MFFDKLFGTTIKIMRDISYYIKVYNTSYFFYILKKNLKKLKIF